MFKIKGWIAHLKSFEPRILALSGQNAMVRNISRLSDQTNFKKNTLYIGTLSSVVYRFLSLSGITLFLIDDQDVVPGQRNFGDNCVILFPPNTNPEALYEKCKEYLVIQEVVAENTQKLMEAYLADGSLQSILDSAAQIIGNPMMVIDNGYRVICFTNSRDCDDLQWMQSIEMGYCSYEFVSQFNKLSEIDAIQRETSPVLAGCMMSPMRRCISRMFVDKKSVGYLLAIESTTQFNEEKVETLEVVSKLLSKSLAFAALQSGQDIHHSTWDALINAIERIPGSSERLREYLRNSGYRMNAGYHLLLLSLDDYNIADFHMAPLYTAFRAVFPKCVFSYYKNNVLLLVEHAEEQGDFLCLVREKEASIREKNYKVAVSDRFYDLNDMKRYYDQVIRTERFMKRLRPDAFVCAYNDIRSYDMILSGLEEKVVPLYIRKTELDLYEYDREHGTEYFKTLYVYIKNGRSLQGAADELFIHKNTVSYRINRLRELFDLDLNDAEVCIGIYLAYQTMELLTTMGGKSEV